jgi:hypothetical protein
MSSHKAVSELSVAVKNAENNSNRLVMMAKFLLSPDSNNVTVKPWLRVQ